MHFVPVSVDDIIADVDGTGEKAESGGSCYSAERLRSIEDVVGKKEGSQNRCVLRPLPGTHGADENDRLASLFLFPRFRGRLMPEAVCRGGVWHLRRLLREIRRADVF